MAPPNHKPADRSEIVLTGGPMVGRDFGGAYRIEAEIGHGGIGVVYRAINRKLDRPVALKLLLKEAVGSSQLLQRFEREAKTLAAMSHPNIVTILDTGVSESVPYLVMELLEGQSLAEVLEGATEPLPLPRAERIIRELLSALDYVHARGLVHRDLKPGNVFLQRLPRGGEQAKLLDFGLAKFLDPQAEGGAANITRSGEVFGTPAYMPAEQWTGQKVDARADVYSAAVVCFELLAGRKPFLGESSDMLRQQLTESVPLLHEACPERVACPELDRLLQRALSRDAEERPRDASELLAELEALPKPWLYSGADATAERRSAALANRDTGKLGTAATVQQAALSPAALEELRSTASRTAPRRSLLGRIFRAFFGLVRRLLLAGAWTLTALSVFAIGIAGAAIYVMQSPDHVEQRAALERALPPLRDAVTRGAVVAQSAVEGAVADAKQRVSAALEAQAKDAAAPQPDAVAPSQAATTPEVAPPAARQPAHDPWSGPAPKELSKVRARISKGQRGDKRMLRDLRSYNREHPDDPRGHLLLARLFVNRAVWGEVVAQYALAFARDPGSRGDTRALQHLLTAIGHEAAAARAADLVRTTYGDEARDAVARALSEASEPDHRARLAELARALPSL